MIPGDRARVLLPDSPIGIFKHGEEGVLEAHNFHKYDYAVRLASGQLIYFYDGEIEPLGDEGAYRRGELKTAVTLQIVVAALEQAMFKLSDETERAKVIGKRIMPSDVAAICAGAARLAALLEGELGIPGPDSSQGIRTVLSRVKLKMGVIVT